MTAMVQRQQNEAEAAEAFEAHRRFLRSLAYRMLGSLAEAEDAVQDCYLRWHQADRSEVTNTRALPAVLVQITGDVLFTSSLCASARGVMPGHVWTIS